MNIDKLRTDKAQYETASAEALAQGHPALSLWLQNVACMIGSALIHLNRMEIEQAAQLVEVSPEVPDDGLEALPPIKPLPTQEQLRAAYTDLRAQRPGRVQ